MDVDWFVAAVIIGVVFYVFYLVVNSLGMLNDSWFSSMFGAAYILGALIVIVLLAKPLFFSTRETRPE